MSTPQPLEATLERIAAALERLSPGPPPPPDFSAAEAFAWHAGASAFQPVAHVNRVPLALLKGIDRTSQILLDNTRRFARGLPANNALLWGARGMGKSSLVKAAHAEVSGAGSPPATAGIDSTPATAGIDSTSATAGIDSLPATAGIEEGVPPPKLKLVEIHREDIGSLPACLAQIKTSPCRFIVFCDDLSFDKDDTSYKSLKAVLEGGIEGRPENVIFYATSNRRHLMPREMVENERSTAINPAEATEEKVSLSDRFGLWLGFHNATQDDYLAMVRAYVAHFNLPDQGDELQRDCLEWATTRGARSGRVAWQYVQDLAGRLGVRLEPS